MTGIGVAPFTAASREEIAPPRTIAQSAAVADPFTPIYRRGDVVIAWMVAAHLAITALLAPIHDTWRVSATVGMSAAAIYFLCMGFAHGRFVTRNMAGLVLQTFCALHIYQMQGLAEMHFFFFTAVTAMIVYQDWRAMWLGVFAIIGQHTLFSYWHNAGVHPGGQAFFEPDHVSLLKISFHFGIALVQVVFAAWCAQTWRTATERTFTLTATNERLQEREHRLERSTSGLANRVGALEEQLRQSQKTDAVGRLASAIAHDFNNLLTVIQSHAEFALSPAGPETRRLADIEQIRRAADSGAQLTRQLLTFSRTQGLAPSCIDLNVAIGETLEMVKRVVGKNIEVTTATESGLAGIWADPGQIQQVLLNLVMNAADAMPSGGQLRFETLNVTVGAEYQSTADTPVPSGRYVMLTVQDTGVGMTEEVRARIFEPFFTTKEVGQGTGLGLATVHGIVKQSNGYIWVDSEPGVGTTFQIFFPPHHEQGRVPEARLSAVVPLSSTQAHILVVEDQTAVRAALCRALSESGCTCSEAKHAAEAIVILANDQSIDLMIIDMVTPGMSAALMREIRLTHPNLPVLILSGNSEAAANPSWRVPDHASFLEKPVSPSELTRRVRQMLGQNN